MTSRPYWYLMKFALIVIVLALGFAVSVFIYRLQIHPFFQNFLAIVVWVTLGAELGGPWTYRGYLQEEREIAAALRERSEKLRQSDDSRG